MKKYHINKEKEKDKIIYSSGNIKDIDHRIDNEANPSKLINKTQNSVCVTPIRIQ